MVRKERSVATQPPSRANIRDASRQVRIFSQPGTPQAGCASAGWRKPPTWAQANWGLTPHAASPGHSELLSSNRRFIPSSSCPMASVRALRPRSTAFRREATLPDYQCVSCVDNLIYPLFLAVSATADHAEPCSLHSRCDGSSRQWCSWQRSVLDSPSGPGS